jgi:hypothetical protein
MSLPNLRWYVDRNRWNIMMFLPNKMCYVDWEGYDSKISRQIWITMWIITDDRGWYFHLIWCAMWSGTYSEIMLSWHNWKCYVDWKGCDRKFSRPIWSTMWNITDDKGWCHDIIWGDIWIGQILSMLSCPNLKCSVDWNVCDRKLSRPICCNMWFKTYDTRWSLDRILGALWLEQLWMYAIMN